MGADKRMRNYKAAIEDQILSKAWANALKRTRKPIWKLLRDKVYSPIHKMQFSHARLQLTLTIEDKIVRAGLAEWYSEN